MVFFKELILNFSFRFFLLLIGCYTLSPVEVFSQDSFFQFYNINKIRSNEVIKSISKDEKGFIWLATDQGVLRYDGIETFMFYKELPSPFAKKFLKRRNGQLYIVTDFGIREIIRSEDSTYFKPIVIGGKTFLEPLNFSKNAFEDKEGNVWAGEVSSLVKISDKDYKRYELGDRYRSINYHRTFSFTEDVFGNLWIAPFKGRLLKYVKEVDKLIDVEVDYPISEVTCVITVKGDNLIIGGKEGILRIKVNSDQAVIESEMIGGPEDVSAAIAISNDIYIGTWEDGLYHANVKQDSISFKKVEELPFNDVLDFYHDKEQDEVWVTGSENIGLLKPSIIKTFNRSVQIRIESFSSDTSENLYFSSGPQIYRLSLNNQNRLQLIHSSKTTYFNQIRWENDKLWIGGSFGEISYYDLKNKSLINVSDSGTNSIQYILKDSQNNKWFTGHADALKRIDSLGRFKSYPVRNTAVIKESPQNKIFCGAKGKDSILCLYNPSKDAFDHLNLKFNFNPSQDIQVEDIAFDSLSNPWLATNEGLLKVTLKNGKYHANRIQFKGIDANEPIKAISIINDNIWLAYSFALVVYHQGQIISYTRENGLPSRVLKERGFYAHNDKLYVATAKGLAEVDYKKASYSFTTKPLFKTLLINGGKVHNSEKDKLKFPYGSRVQVDFVSLSYPGNNILYQTRLSGLEDNWSDPSPNNSISVLGFTEGDYTLEVRAREDGKMWSEPLNLPFNISAPWFKSGWAIIFFIGSGALFIYGSVKIYHLHLLRQRTKLKQIIEKRTQEINQQKNQIIEQKNKIIQQKEELIEKNNAVFHSQKALSEADLNYLHLKEKQLQDQISYRNKQITTHALNIIQKNEMLKELKEQLEDIIKNPDGNQQGDLKKLLRIIDESFRHDKDWDEFKMYFEQIYTGFHDKLKVNYPELTNQDLRHCSLIRLNLRNNECASILGISPSSIKVSRNRLKKKLNLENHESLTDFLLSL